MIRVNLWQKYFSSGFNLHLGLIMLMVHVALKKMPFFLLKHDFFTSVALQRLLAESMCMYFQWIWSILDCIPLCGKKCPNSHFISKESKTDES